MFIEVESFEQPGAALYIDLSERQLCHIREPDQGYFIAESAYVIERALKAGFEPVSMLTTWEVAQGEAAEVVKMCTGMDAMFPVYIAPPQLFKHVKGFLLTRGVLCAMKRKPMPQVRSLLKQARRLAVLEEVENPVNMGSIFRSAAALGIDAVLLADGCTDPLYRRAERVSMGTVFQVPWTIIDWETLDPEEDPLENRNVQDSYMGGVSGQLRPAGRKHRESPWPAAGMDCLKELGFQTAAMALAEKSLPMDAPQLKVPDKLAILMGSEGYGLKEETIRLCDFTVKIPMYHGVDSLNVAAASAVAFWELRAGRK